MTYQEAITAVKNGQTVKRSSWTGKTVSQTTDSVGDTQISLTQTTTITAPYLAGQEDMYANDWTTV
jgi:hypothetical protein